MLVPLLTDLKRIDPLSYPLHPALRDRCFRRVEWRIRYVSRMDDEKPTLGERISHHSWVLAPAGLLAWVTMLWLMFGDVL